MSTEEIEQLDLSAAPLGCTDDEEAELAHMHAEWEQNFSLFQQKRASLIREHHGAFCLVYRDSDGISRVRVDRDLARLRASVGETALSGAVLEYLRTPSELMVPTAMQTDD